MISKKATKSERTYALGNGEVLMLREAGSGDVKALLTLMERLSQETDLTAFGPGEYGSCEATMERTIETFRDRKNSIYCLATINDEIVGMVSFQGGHRSRNRHCGYLAMSVIRPHWRKGIGTRLMNFIEEWARDSGMIQKINLWVRADNEPAIKLYLKSGYAIEGRTRDTFFLDGRYFDHALMGRSLRSETGEMRVPGSGT